MGERAGDGVPAVGPSHRDGPMLFVDDLDAPELTRDDYHHIVKVLREKEGTPIVVCDGAGSWRTAILGQHPQVTGEVATVPVPTPRLIVAFALIKGDRPELVVQKLTELGVDEIVPMTTDNAVVKPKGDRITKQLDRFARIAREASMQCRRTHLPTIGALSTYDHVVASHPFVIRCDAGGVGIGEAIDRALAANSEQVVVAIGPEGGWSERERNLDATVAGIGAHILRAETAAISAAALVAARRISLI